MARNPLGNPHKGYNIRWFFRDAKSMVIGVAVLFVVCAPCAVGSWYYSKVKKKQQIFDEAIAACPQDRTKMMCMRNVEKMHETCYTRSVHPDRPSQQRFDYFGYRRCVGVPIKQGEFDPFKLLKGAGG